jgi:hypothetical protein
MGVPLVRDDGLVGIARSLLLQLPKHLDDADETIATALGRASLELLGAALPGSSVVP